MKLLFIIILGLATVSCTSTKNAFFSQTQEIGEFETEWYSKHLVAAKEKPLNQKKGLETFRFTWLRTFHSPIIVRIDCTDKCILESKSLSGKGGYSPGKIKHKNRLELTAQQTSKFKQLFSKINGWKFLPEEEIIGMDGAQWIFEHSSENNYQFWDLWSPKSQRLASNYVAMCLYLIEISNLKIDENYVY